MPLSRTYSFSLLDCDGSYATTQHFFLPNSPDSMDHLLVTHTSIRPGLDAAICAPSVLNLPAFQSMPCPHFQPIPATPMRQMSALHITGTSTPTPINSPATELVLISTNDAAIHLQCCPTSHPQLTPPVADYKNFQMPMGPRMCHAPPFLPTFPLQALDALSPQISMFQDRAKSLSQGTPVWCQDQLG